MALVNDILEIKVYTSLGQQGAINVLHAKVATITGSGVGEVNIANSVSTSLAALYKPLIATVASYRGVGVRVIWPYQTLESFSINGQGAGTATGEPLPKQICGVLAFRTSVPRQAGRGRIYLPFPSEGDNDTDASPTAGYITRMQTLAAYFLTTINVVSGADANTFTFHLYHRASHTSDLIQQTVSRDKWGTQQRRGDYGKANALPI